MRKLLKSFILLSGAALVLAGCSKELIAPNDLDVTGEGDVTVSLTTSLSDCTRAVSDNDGHAVQVDHWVMEVRDYQGNLFTRQERDNVAAGTLKQTFRVRLYKNHEYTFQFWADTKGQYNTDDLTAVSATGTVSNDDTRDAFSANHPYTATKNESISVTLRRPFAQLNIQTNDLEELFATATDSLEYMRYEPDNFALTLTVPAKFNVKTQEAFEETDFVLSAANVYTAYEADSTTAKAANNYALHVNPATLFMDYIFAGGEKGIFDMHFVFNTNSKDVDFDFRSIPLQRNYRTNIKGNLLSYDTEWVVEINPEWYTPDYDVPYLEASTLEQAQAYIGTSGSEKAKVLNLQEGAVKATDVQDDPVYGKVVNFVLKTTSPKDLSFQLPALTGEVAGAAWKISYESGYPTENVIVDAPAGTSVIIDAPTSHVEVSGTSYVTIVASTDANTLVIPAGCTVDSLIIKQGGLEIYGTVSKVEVQGTAENVFVRTCQGLSDEVYAVLSPYIAKGWEAVKNGETWDIVLTSNDWALHAAKTFGQIDEAAKTLSINSEAEFALFANKVNAGTTYEGWTVTLTNELDMSAYTWTPIGNFTDDTPFKGTFDGKNMQIRGLYVYSKDKKGVGVFGKVYAPCVLKNINVVDAYVLAEGTNTYTGGLVGHGYAKIDNCSFIGDVHGGNQMGGIAASGGFTITNCYFDGNIYGKYWGLGGIIGNCQDGGAISGNQASGKIVGVLDDCKDPFIAGGIIGCAIYTSYPVKNNFSSMEISFNGEPQTGFPVMGVYNIDNPGTGNEDFANLLTCVADNSWNPEIFTETYYPVYYNNGAPVAAGYEINFGAATTKVVAARIGDTEYASLNDALAAVKDAETIVIGRCVDTPAAVGAIANVSGKTFTVEGTDKAKSVVKIGDGKSCGSDGYCDYRFQGANVTFSNLTFAQTYEGNSWYQGLVRVGDLCLNNCIVKGTACYWGNNCQIDSCTFDRTDKYEYSIYTWGCAQMTVKDSEFNTQGKAIKMYGAGTSVLNVEGCTFNSNGMHAGADKPAIAVNTQDYTTDYTLNIKNCTQNGFVAGASDSALWGSDKAAEISGNLNVYVDEVLVWKDGKKVED